MLHVVNGLSLVILGADGGANAMACATLNKRVVSARDNNVMFSMQYRDDFDR